MNKDFLNLQKEVVLLRNIQSVLDWDQQCFMPSLGCEYRSSQMSYLAGLTHEKIISSEYEDKLAQYVESTHHLEDHHPSKVDALLTKRRFERQSRFPVSLVKELAAAKATAQSKWEVAKQKNGYEFFKSSLKEVVYLTKQEALCLKTNDETVYDVLISEYERGVDTKFLNPLFKDLKTDLKSLLGTIPQGEKKPQTAQAVSHYDVKIQEQLCFELATMLGFDQETGILTKSAHPFSTTLGPKDFRITTRYNPTNFISSFMGVAHEVGHALYEKGLPPNEYGLEVWGAASCGVHESQSLFWEKKIASHREFLTPWHSRLQKAFPHDYSYSSPEELYLRVNRVAPSLIRVDADEVTYCLHVMIRYEIEKMMFDGSFDFEELPRVWNRLYLDYLGIEPSNNIQGCLQDVHWACGAFGYFPSYALGHLMSAQFSQTLEKELGPLDRLIREKQFPAIRNWLGKTVHSRGSTLPPLDLVTAITGKPLSSKPFIEYLRGKFSNTRTHSGFS